MKPKIPKPDSRLLNDWRANIAMDNTTVAKKRIIDPISSPLREKNNSDLFNSNKTQYVDSVLNANKDKEWVQRLTKKQTTANSIQDPYEPQYKSTHLMSDDGNGYVYPTVIKQGDKLIHYPTELKLNEEQSIEYAKKNNIGIQLPKRQGTWFANNGYKIGTNINNNIDPKTGIPFNDPDFKLNAK
jgi:hypothetical protein